MSARAVLVVMVVMLAACGGGEEGCGGLDLVIVCFGSDDGDDAGATPPELTIATPAHAEPSHAAAYVTTADAVRIAGTTSDVDADIIWTNSAGGEGDASPEWEFCTLSCAYDWSTSVPLSVGYNVITVVAIGDGGSTAATIAITRVR